MASFRAEKISDYGLIGDTRTAALISKNGSLDWCCFPRFDSPSFFAALLDQDKGGHFKLYPSEIYTSEQTYLKDTNVLVTQFKTKTGLITVTDCFTVLSEAEKKNILSPYHEILRVIDCVSGEVEMNLGFSPRPYFATKEVKLEFNERLGIYCNCGSELLNLQSDLPFTEIKIINRSEAVACFQMHQGQRHVFSLSYADDAPAVFPDLQTASLRLKTTIQYWEHWVQNCKYHGPYLEQVKRSALALKLLIFAPSGAIIAAPTTSLPESIGGVRNWDYRFCWLRDASFTVRSLLQLGFEEEAKAYASWILHSTNLTRPKIQILYDIYGRTHLPEKNLDWFSGYRDSRPVRTGNAAYEQLQLDVYGEVLDAIYYFSDMVPAFDKDTVNFLLGMGEVIIESWDQPDEGIWEVRSGKSFHTHSKVMSWVALDRLIKLSKKYKWKTPIKKYLSLAKKLKVEIENEGYNEKIRAYTSAYGTDQLDANVLIMPLVGFCKANSERMQNTCKALCENLSKNGLLYRYQKTNDGILGKEGAFNICNLWLVENLALAGKLTEAQAWFESYLSKSNSLKLWSEEMDPLTDEFLGNYPQSFSHTGLISAAITLEQETKKMMGDRL